MDIVLSVFDNLFFDRFYATLLPLASGISLDTLKNNATNLAGAAAIAATRLNAPIENDIVSEYFGFEPTKYALLSQWQRSDWERQALSLGLITWYLHPLSTETSTA
jgi:lathosterol oxidase